MKLSKLFGLIAALALYGAANKLQPDHAELRAGSR